MNHTGLGRLEDMVKNIGMLIAAFVLLSGCAGNHPVGLQTSPAPDVAPAPAAGPARGPEAGPRISREGMPAPEASKATGALLARARQNEQAGKLGQAEIFLESALRVEPRNPMIWHEMAQVKYGQQEYGQVVQYCNKSISLAGNDSDLTQQNLKLLEKAYLELGEPVQARKAGIRVR